jgi:hypothetical protein
VSERRGCQAMRFDRSTHRYQPIRDEQAPLRKRMREIALVRVRYGYRRIHVLLRREGCGEPQACQAALSIRGLEPLQQTSAPTCQGGASLGASKADGRQRDMGVGFCVRRAI